MLIILLPRRTQLWLRFRTYPLLGELTGTLVPGVAEQLDHTLLIGSETARVKKSVEMSWYKMRAIKVILWSSIPAATSRAGERIRGTALTQQPP